MNKVLIVAHAPLASAFQAAALHVFSDAGDYLDYVDVQADATPQSSAAIILQKAIALTEDGSGCLVLVDIFGATPCNAAIHALGKREDVAILTGMSLPMLLRVLNYRAQDLLELVGRATEGATVGVRIVQTPSMTVPSSSLA